MEVQGTGNHVTIKDAAKVLGVSTKSIQRYLKNGLLTKLKVGTRTFVPLSDVEAMTARTRDGQGQIRSRRGKRGAPRVGDTVTLHREKYEALLIELGELRQQSQYLDDARLALSAQKEEVINRDRDMMNLRNMIEELERRSREKDHELLKGAQRIQELEAELEKSRSQKPWWQK